MRVVFVDKRNCTACGLCEELEPSFFRMDDDDLAESHNYGKNVNAALVAVPSQNPVQGVVEDCPGECIHWQDPR